MWTPRGRERDSRRRISKLVDNTLVTVAPCRISSSQPEGADGTELRRRRCLHRWRGPGPRFLRVFRHAREGSQRSLAPQRSGPGRPRPLGGSADAHPVGPAITPPTGPRCCPGRPDRSKSNGIRGKHVDNARENRILALNLVDNPVVAAVAAPVLLVLPEGAITDRKAATQVLVSAARAADRGTTRSGRRCLHRRQRTASRVVPSGVFVCPAMVRSVSARSGLRDVPDHADALTVGVASRAVTAEVIERSTAIRDLADPAR